MNDNNLSQCEPINGNPLFCAPSPCIFVVQHFDFGQDRFGANSRRLYTRAHKSFASIQITNYAVIVTGNEKIPVMAKSNTQRQAEFRAKMREEGKKALHAWVTPEQAAQFQLILARSLPLPKAVTTRAAPLPVTGRKTVGSLPPIPQKTPASIVRSLKESEKILRKKYAQIAKLEKDAAAIESHFRQTVDECKRL